MDASWHQGQPLPYGKMAEVMKKSSHRRALHARQPSRPMVRNIDTVRRLDRTHARRTPGAAGFRNSDISAILPDRDRTTRDLAPEINTKAPEGFTTGASTGAAIEAWWAGSSDRRPCHRPIGATSPRTLNRSQAARPAQPAVVVADRAGIPEIESKRTPAGIDEGALSDTSVHCDGTSRMSAVGAPKRFSKDRRPRRVKTSASAD